jgi:prepilin peptidase CpaA
MYETVATYMMIAMLAVSIVTDVRTGKIFNLLTVPCALAGVTLGIMAGGLPGASDRLLGAALVLLITLLLSPLAGLGGGDVKLLMAVGALQGIHFAAWAMLYAGVAGAVLALLVIIRRRKLKQTTVNLLTNLFAKTAGVSTDLAAGTAVGKIQYSLAIAMGALAALALRA